MKSLFGVLIAAAAPATLWSHEGQPLEPHDLAAAWRFDPLIVAGLALSAWLYLRGDAPGRGLQAWERLCFWAGWWTLVIALISPLHPLGEVLFSAHMVQHELLMLVAAPLLVLGRPLVPFLWALPRGWRRPAGSAVQRGAAGAVWRWISRPFAAWAIHAVVLWSWHAPALFERTVTSDLIHSLQHISFLGSALLFWWAVFGGDSVRMGYGGAVIYVFTTAVHSSALGALLTVSPVVWYPVYEDTAAAWGLTALEDQQLGGLVMWVPAGLVLTSAGLLLFAAWLREADRPTGAALKPE